MKTSCEYLVHNDHSNSVCHTNMIRGRILFKRKDVWEVKENNIPIPNPYVDLSNAVEFVCDKSGIFSRSKDNDLDIKFFPYLRKIVIHNDLYAEVKLPNNIYMSRYINTLIKRRMFVLKKYESYSLKSYYFLEKIRMFRDVYKNVSEEEKESIARILYYRLCNSDFIEVEPHAVDSLSQLREESGFERACIFSEFDEDTLEQIALADKHWLPSRSMTPVKSDSGYASKEYSEDVDAQREKHLMSFLGNEHEASEEKVLKVIEEYKEKTEKKYGFKLQPSFLKKDVWNK